MESVMSGDRQNAYQILVASTSDLLALDKGDVWDSGKVISSQSMHVSVFGKDRSPLGSGQTCYWKVRIWDAAGHPSSWSKPALWTEGLLQTGDWHGAFITADDGIPPDASVWLRKEFVLSGKPLAAWAYVNLIGYGELYVNGHKIGADVLTPAVSDYNNAVPYVTYDIAPFLKPGKNCLGLWLGRGWATKMPGLKRPAPAVRLQCSLAGAEAEGKSEIVTDATWKVSPSTYRTLGSQSWGDFGGESYDARLEKPGWNLPGLDDSAWAPAQVLALNVPPAIGQIAPLNRLNPPIPAQTVTDLGENCYEIDFGTDLSGWLQLQIPAMPSGQKVDMAYADKRAPVGTPQTDWPAAMGARRQPPAWNYQDFNQHDEYISNGKPGVFSSKFNYHGFRYVLVKGLPAPPEVSTACARLVDSNVETTGNFACSNPFLNQIHAIDVWTARCLNLGGYMVDCPHRERMGYGDGQVEIETCLYNFDDAAFYAKWLGDWKAANPGEFTHTAPMWGGGGGPGWGGCLAALTWRLYLFTGDPAFLEANLDGMRNYLNRIEARCENNVLRKYGTQWDFIGDWVAPGRGMDTNNWPDATCEELFNNCYRVYLWELQENAAQALGKTDEAALCQKKLETIRPLIHAAFYHSDTHEYVNDKQTYQVMPLTTDVVPPSEHDAVLKNLVDLIQVKNNGHLDTGSLGTYFLVQYLQEIGRNDLVYTIVDQKTYPGWGFMAEQGATTLWEQWNGYYSHIHSCFLSLDGWFYQGLAGIRPDPTAPGFQKFILQPAIVGDLTWMKASYDSPYGPIISQWKIEAGKLTMDVTIPPNASATVVLPTRDAASISVNGHPLRAVSGLLSVTAEPKDTRVEAGSGRYSFTFPWKG
jgi:alpha-L-rhamnosidase